MNQRFGAVDFVLDGGHRLRDDLDLVRIQVQVVDARGAQERVLVLLQLAALHLLVDVRVN